MKVPSPSHASGAGPSLSRGRDTGLLIVDETRRWIGTPYRHQASVRGVGCDCLGLVRGVWREVVGEEPEAVPAYQADWAEVGARETLLEAAGRWMTAVPLAEVEPGDVLMFRMSDGAMVKHCAVLASGRAGGETMIHAYWGRAVVESWLGTWWRRRLAAAFRMPEQ